MQVAIFVNKTIEPLTKEKTFGKTRGYKRILTTEMVIECYYTTRAGETVSGIQKLAGLTLFLKKKKSFYLWLRCILVAESGHCSLVGLSGLCVAVSSFAAEGSLWGFGVRSVACWLSCHTARGILPDQEWNSCLLHWQADSLPLSYQGRPGSTLNTSIFCDTN